MKILDADKMPCDVFQAVCSFFNIDGHEDGDGENEIMKEEKRRHGNSSRAPKEASTVSGTDTKNKIDTVRRRMGVFRRYRVSPDKKSIRKRKMLPPKTLFGCTRHQLQDTIHTTRDEAENMKTLERMFPSTTLMERHRFASGRTLKKSVDRMGHYIKWRTQLNLDDETFTSSQYKLHDDEKCWNFVVSYISKQMYPVVELNTTLPRIVRFGSKHEEPRTRDGKRVAHILAAMIDLDIAPQEFYMACIAAYLDFKLDRNSLETITVLIDVRAGKGWKNPPAMSLVPFIKTIAKYLSIIMPLRLESCIVYPLPSPARFIWVIVSGLLDMKHLQKIRILWGAGASAESPAPTEKMKEFFDMNTIEKIEQCRLLEFT